MITWPFCAACEKPRKAVARVGNKQHAERPWEKEHLVDQPPGTGPSSYLLTLLFGPVSGH